MSKRRPDPASYFPWNVIHDPQRMYTGPFRAIDLRETAAAGYWPDGIIFQHQRTGQRLIFQDGALVEPLEEQAA